MNIVSVLDVISAIKTRNSFAEKGKMQKSTYTQLSCFENSKHMIILLLVIKAIKTSVRVRVCISLLTHRETQANTHQNAKIVGLAW